MITFNVTTDHLDRAIAIRLQPDRECLLQCAGRDFFGNPCSIGNTVILGTDSRNGRWFNGILDETGKQLVKEFDAACDSGNFDTLRAQLPRTVTARPRG